MAGKASLCSSFLLLGPRLPRTEVDTRGSSPNFCLSACRSPRGEKISSQLRHSQDRKKEWDVVDFRKFLCRSFQALFLGQDSSRATLAWLRTLPVCLYGGWVFLCHA